MEERLEKENAWEHALSDQKVKKTAWVREACKFFVSYQKLDLKILQAIENWS